MKQKFQNSTNVANLKYLPQKYFIQLNSKSASGVKNKYFKF